MENVAEEEHEKEFQLEDEEVQRKVDNALETYLKFEEEVKRKLRAEEEELQSGNKEVQRKLDEALEFYFRLEDEGKRMRLAERTKIIDEISSEPGEDVGPSKQEEEEEEELLHVGEEEVQRELEETLKLQRQTENEAEHKELEELQDIKLTSIDS